jgi:predicted Zn-dependent peptidase
VDAWHAAFAYRGPARELVARVKYRNARAAVPWLAAAMVDALGDHPAFDAVTWAPTVAARRRRRGFDPAQLLAVAVADRLESPVMRLLRRLPGPPQTGLDGAARRVGPRFLAIGPVPARVLLVDKPDATQTYFWMGNRGVARKDPDRDVVDVANTAFGGRFTSILNSEMRTKSGLTYGVRCRFMRLGQPGSVAISSFTKTDSTQRAMDMALRLLGQLRDKGIDATMVASVKGYLSGLYPPELETGDEIATTLADLAYHGLPTTEATQYVERIERVQEASILPVIDRVYPDPKDLSIVMIGNAAAIRKVA